MERITPVSMRIVDSDRLVPLLDPLSLIDDLRQGIAKRTAGAADGAGLALLRPDDDRLGGWFRYKGNCAS